MKKTYKVNKKACNIGTAIGVILLILALIMPIFTTAAAVRYIFFSGGEHVIATAFGWLVNEDFQIASQSGVTLEQAIGLFFSGVVMGLTLLCLSIRAFMQVSKAKKYAKIFENYPRMKMTEVMKKAGKTLRGTSSDLSVLQKRNYFPDLSFDLINKDVVLVSGSTEPLPLLDSDTDTVYTEHTNNAAFILNIIFTVGLIGVFIHIVPKLIAALVFAIALGKIFPLPKYLADEDAGDAMSAMIEQMRKPAATGNNDLDTMLNSVYESKKELVRLSGVIKSAKIRTPLSEILRYLDQITTYVSENQEKSRNLRQFANYYLPTTVRFLKDYEELEGKPNKGENITTALLKIEKVTADMVRVFEQELNDLYADKAMDISAEVAVMESIIKENESVM